VISVYVTRSGTQYEVRAVPEGFMVRRTPQPDQPERRYPRGWNGHRVPPGEWLLATDVVVTPSGLVVRWPPDESGAERSMATSPVVEDTWRADDGPAR
jgi:hypothetical protein